MLKCSSSLNWFLITILSGTFDVKLLIVEIFAFNASYFTDSALAILSWIPSNFYWMSSLSFIFSRALVVADCILIFY